MKRGNSYRAAIIGCGRIGCSFDSYGLGFSFTHLSAYRVSKRVEVVAVCDSDLGAARFAAKKGDVHNFFSDVKKMLRETRPDIVSICTPDDTHYSILKEVLKCGSVKAIWCEKPLAVTLRQGQEMVRLCKRKKIKLLVNHLRRYDSFYEQIKEGMDKNVGKIQSVVCYYTGGVVTTGSHLIDLLVYLFGSCVSVSGTRTNGEGDILGELRFKNGMIAHILPCDNRHFLAMDMTLLGSKARLDTINKPFIHYDYRYYPVEKDRKTGSLFVGRDSKDIFSRTLKRDFFPKALSDLISSLESGKTLRSSGEDALRSLEIIAALSYSAKRGGIKVRLPFKMLDFRIPAARGDLRKWKN